MTPHAFDHLSAAKRTKPEAPAGFHGAPVAPTPDDHISFHQKSYRVCTESVEELAALRHMEKGTPEH